MSAFTPVVPRKAHTKQMEEVEVVEDTEEIEEIEEIEVEVYPGEVELEDDDGVTLTELEGIVIRSAETRPDSWPKNKRRAPPSPTPTEVGEDSPAEEEQVVFPKVVLKFKGKVEGVHTRAKEQSKVGKGKRQVNEEADNSTGPTDTDNSTLRRRNGAELGDAEDQAYWLAHQRFAKCPGGIWLHEAVKPGFAHSSVAMRDTCKAAYHVLMATPADCPFYMGETDLDYMKYLRTAVVGYKKRLEKGMGFASHRRVQGLCETHDGESDEEEEEEEEARQVEEAETQVIDSVEVGQAGPSSMQAMAQMQKDLHSQFEELKKQREILTSMQQQQEENVRHQNLQSFSHHSSFDGVLMVAPLPETQEEAYSAARQVVEYLSTLPADKQTKAHKTAIRLAKEHPQKYKTVDEWVSAMQYGPLGRHKPYTIKIALIQVLNPMKSCTWAYSQVGARISHACTILSMAYNLRTQTFTRSDIEWARDQLPNMDEGQPSFPLPKVSEKWTSSDETKRRAAAALAETFGRPPPAAASAPAPSYPRFNDASLQVMQAAAQAAREQTAERVSVDLTCDEDAAVAAPASAPAPAPAPAPPFAWTVDASGTVVPTSSTPHAPGESEPVSSSAPAPATSPAPAPASVPAAPMPMRVDLAQPTNFVLMCYYLNCSLLFGAVQEDKTLTFYQRRRVSECAHNHYNRETKKSADEIWKDACSMMTEIVGRQRLLRAAALLENRKQEGCRARAHFHHASLNRFKAEKARAVDAGMNKHDFPLQAAWCEPLWNRMTESQKKVFTEKPSAEAANAVLTALFG